MTELSTATPVATKQPQKRKVVKVTTNLPEAVFVALRELAEERGVSMTELLRQAISTEKFVNDALNRGEAIMLASPNRDTVREVFFKR